MLPAALEGRSYEGSAVTIIEVTDGFRPANAGRWRVEVTGGSISLDGRALQGLPTHEISRLGVGWVPEDRRIFSDLTVAENLLVGAKGGSGWSVTRVFDYFPKLGQMAGRRGGSLSGGEQQRVCIARALINDPKIVLADEPTGNLHSSQGEEIMELFRKLNDEGMTIVQVTHSDKNASYGKRVIQLRDGWIVNK